MSIKTELIKNLPSILTGVAVAGVVETVILAVKATPKALEVLEEVPVEEMKNKKDVVKHTWKCYIPAAIAGGMTIGCILMANHVHLVKEAGIVAAYWKLGSKFQDYKEKAGEKTNEKVEKAIQKEHISEAVANKPEAPLEVGKVWVYEPESEQYFQATTEQILWAELTANKMFANQGWLSLNQFLELLPNAERVDFGDYYGWYTIDEDGSWDFNWSFYRGTPWIDIQPQIAEDDDVMVLAYGMHPGNCPDPNDIEEPEQITEKPVVVKHS